MRKLASIQKITGIRPIAGADRIEVADVLGWSVVVKKGDFKVGDLAVYFEIDSFLNAADDRYATFEDRFINWNGTRGMRLKTIKLRKQISQGLLLKVDDFEELTAQLLREGEDVTEILKIEKWEPVEESRSNAGGLAKQAGSKPFPAFIRKTDQERVQNYVGELGKHADETFEVTVKLDGSSMTVYRVDKSSPYFDQVVADVEAQKLRRMTKFQKLWYNVKKYFGAIKAPISVSGVCSRNIELDINDSNHFSTFTREHELLELLDHVSENLAIQGELIAPSIQGNYEKVDTFLFCVYDVFLIDQQRYAEPMEARFFAEVLGFNYVPVINHEVKLAQFGDVYTDPRGVVEAILAFAEGPSLNPDVQREGVVFKSNDSDFSFKAISNNYLLKKEGK